MLVATRYSIISLDVLNSKIVNHFFHFLQYAIVSGIPSGISVRFFKADQTFWNSFENTTSLTLAKLWALTLVCGLSISLIAASVNLFIVGYKVELLIGFCTSGLILSIIYEPVIAIFNHQWMTKYKKRKKIVSIECISEVICGQGAVATPKHFYVLFWSVLFIAALLDDKDGIFRQRWWPS